MQKIEDVEDETPQQLDLRVLLDDHRALAHPAGPRWLRRHPRVRFHFIPTSSSWLALVERRFGGLTDKASRRGAFARVRELSETNDEHITA
ncbi:MAG: hypothetical protein OZ928_07470 [Polyangiaceae bacterium]|nr:hypothetical protein [Polyangiaceae bacterium]